MAAVTPCFIPYLVEALEPPCVGFFDHNGRWHLITRLVDQEGSESYEYRPKYTSLPDTPERQPVATHK